MKRALNSIRVAALLALLAGCTTTQRERFQRQYDRLPWRDKPEPEQPVTPQPEQPDEPLPPLPPQPEPPPIVEPEPIVEPPIVHPPVIERHGVRWFERNGRAVVQIRADYQARGRGVITAHGHKHIVPDDPGDEPWFAAVSRTPADRRVDGYDEWVLPFSMSEIAARARSMAPGSGTRVMIFAKGRADVTYFIFADRLYPPNVPVKNITNNEWQGMR